MTLLKEHPGVRPEELESPIRPPVRPRPSPRAMLVWALVGVVLLAGITALAIWLISREDPVEPVVTTPVISAPVETPAAVVEVPTGDGSLLELLAVEGRATPVIPESGDGHLLEVIARRSTPTLTELPTGDAAGLEPGVPIDPSTPTESPTGDGQGLEDIASRLAIR